MNKLKRTLALAATLVMTASAFASCGSSSESPATSTPKKDPSSGAGEPATTAPEKIMGDEDVNPVDASLGQGGDNFTVVSWDPNDAPKMIDLYNKNKGDLKEANFVNMDVNGGGARDKYNAMFQADEHIDLFFAEADWALSFIDSDKSVPLEKVGFRDENFKDIFAYTDEIGKDSEGVRKGVSWQACAGGFAYRTDLAEKFLGVKSADEMQAAIGNWAKFEEAAATVAKESGGKTALADTLGGLWQVFTAGRTQPWVSGGSLQMDDSCKQFADLAKNLWDGKGITQYSQWTGEWTGAGVKDEAMGYFVPTWGFGGYFLDAAGGEGGAAYGKWNLVQGPQSFFWGGTWMLVHSKTDNANECQKFIKTLAVDKATMKEYAKSKPEFVNNQKVMAEVVSDNDYTLSKVTYDNLQQQNFFGILADAVAKIDLRGTITAYDSTIKAAFLDAVTNDYCKGGKSWDDTVASFKKAVDAALPDINVG